jgi:hypothetical protein
MDAGIAAQSNLTWLRQQGYHYVVVSKLRERQFDPAQVRISAHRDRRFRDRDRTFRPMMTAHFG